ncbi:unnamed protein product [Boreogadus saida]
MEENWHSSVLSMSLIGLGRVATAGRVLKSPSVVCWGDRERWECWGDGAVVFGSVVGSPGCKMSAVLLEVLERAELNKLPRGAQTKLERHLTVVVPR